MGAVRILPNCVHANRLRQALSLYGAASAWARCRKRPDSPGPVAPSRAYSAKRHALRRIGHTGAHRPTSAKMSCHRGGRHGQSKATHRKEEGEARQGARLVHTEESSKARGPEKVEVQGPESDPQHSESDGQKKIKPKVCSEKYCRKTAKTNGRAASRRYDH